MKTEEKEVAAEAREKTEVGESSKASTSTATQEPQPSTSSTFPGTEATEAGKDQLFEVS
jgi:hypothetical protein